MPLKWNPIVAGDAGGGATLVFEETDFSGVGTLTAADDFVLNGVTFTNVNKANWDFLGASGDSLRCRSKSGSTTNVFGYDGYRSASRFQALLSDLDPDGLATDGYEFAVEIVAWPSGVLFDEGFHTFFLRTAATVGGDAIAVLGGLPTPRIYLMDGITVGSTVADAGKTAKQLSLRISGQQYGGASGLQWSATPSADIGSGVAVLSSQTSGVPGGSGSIIPDANILVPSNTSVGVCVYGKLNPATGENWDIVSMRLWRLPRV